MQPSRLLLVTPLVALVFGACGQRATTSDAAATLDPTIVEEYLDTYFETFPTRATAAGRHEFDGMLGDLGEEGRSAWLDYNRDVLERIERAGSSGDVELDRDLELLRRQAQRQIMDYDVLDRPRSNPLYWTGILGNATVFLLVRDDQPLETRLARAIERAEAIPRLVDQALEALAGSAPKMAREHSEMAARQARGTALFYRDGFAGAAGDEVALRESMTAVGGPAAEALDRLADFLEELCSKAAGSPRLGDHYAERFRIVTGIETPVEGVLRQAMTALEEKRREVADYGREVWAEVLPGESMPGEDSALVRRLFQRVGDDGAATIEEYVADFKSLTEASVDFVRETDLVTLPEPLTLIIDRSPDYFVGASVGGVYPAGPYAPQDAKTLLFAPTPPDSASDEAKRAFFRDFNHNFNVMIVPHEIIPGHYLQLKYAARHPRKVRAIFGDGVYIEGWGTFCERLMLDQGWGDSLARLAHLKKQLENIARTIVDIRVHTQGMSRDEVLEFVQGEALQEAQFANNMWRRAITSSPQLTSYYLGYDQVRGLFDDVKTARGDQFEIKEFMDGMMEMGPVPVRHYRERMLGGGAGGEG